MPSEWHDYTTEFIREHPTYVRRILLDFFGVDLAPDAPISLVPGDFNDRLSRELLPDKVIIVGAEHDPERIILVEAQQDESRRKRWQWARYSAAAWLRHDCPVDVLVICPDQRIANWYDQPFRTPLPGYTHWPLVLLPHRVPKITRAEDAAADPDMAVLSVAYHGIDPDVARAFVDGMVSRGPELGEAYYDYGYRIAPRVVREILEELVSTVYDKPGVHSPFFTRLREKARAEGREEGREEGQAEARLEGERDKVLLTLGLCGLAVNDDQRKRITDCADLAQLKTWTSLARTVTKTDDLFR